MASKGNGSSRTAANALAVALSLLVSTPGFAWESDVHFGLTKWLALQAGYTQQQAEFIATGNQRADSGLMANMALAYQYACFSKDTEVGAVAQRLHYPSASPLPAEPAIREVVAGGAAARAASADMLKMSPDKAGLMLYRFGESMHVLQDSWAHQGVPEVRPLPHGDCDASLYSGHPLARGGWSSHEADLTIHWSDDVEVMAANSYQLLEEYPPIDGHQRMAKPWAALRPLLKSFIEAPTKAAKAEWFVANGIADTAFLGGVSLPDGPQAWQSRWSGDKLPPLVGHTVQHAVPADLTEFFNGFFTQWMSGGDIERLVITSAGIGQASKAATAERAQLLARLNLWRVRDHGLVAELAHVEGSFDASQLAEANRLTRDSAAYVKYASLTDAVFPLLVNKPHRSPLLPFIIHVLEESPDGTARAAAIVKLRHAPYDTLAVIAEKTAENWHPVAVLPMVEH